MYEIFQELATDSSTGKTDDKLKAAKSMFKNNSQLFIDSIENHLTILP